MLLGIDSGTRPTPLTTLARNGVVCCDLFSHFSHFVAPYTAIPAYVSVMGLPCCLL